jgi:general stress protein YciG
MKEALKMPETGKRGFGSMDQVRQREIASKGGQAAHAKGSAHEFSREEAREAGSKGGKVAHERGSAHEFSSEEARAAGRKGGEASSQDRNRMSEIGREGGRS